MALAGWRRLTASEDYEQAASYVARRLRAAGIDVEILRPRLLVSLPRAATVEILGAGGRRIPAVTHSGTVGSGPEGVVAEVAAAGTPAVAGRVAVALGLANAGAVVAAARSGAVGMVFVNRGDRLHELGISPIWGNPSRYSPPALPAIPVASVGSAGGAPIVAAAQQGLPLTVHLRTEVETALREAALPLATIPGPTDDGWLLVGGHLDGWHLGAMDNAFGNAACLEIARALHHARHGLRRFVRVAWWPGHSDARFAGSTWFVDHFWSELAQGCVGYINIDQPGFREFAEFRLMASPEMAGFLRDLAERRGFRVTGPWPLSRQADMSFVGVGVPACDYQPRLSPGAASIAPDRQAEGLPWYWHHTDDTLDKGDPAVLAAHAELFLAAADTLATQPLLPYDPRAYGAVLAQALEEVAGIPGVAPIRNATERLALAAAALWARMEQAPVEQAPALNRALLAVAHAALPGLHVIGSRVEPGPAVAAPPLPGLHLAAQGDDPQAATAFVRYRNMVVSELERAAAACAAAADR